MLLGPGMSFVNFWELCIMLYHWLYLPKAFAIIYILEVPTFTVMKLFSECQWCWCLMGTEVLPLKQKEHVIVVI